MISYFVEGEPAPQGSKTGKVVNGRVIMWEASAKVKPWRTAVALQTQAYRASKWPNAEQWTIKTPVEITLIFHLPKPKSVKRDFPSVKPDLDKLIRSTFDGLTTGGLYEDDALVIALSASKIYSTDRIGCQITVSEELNV
jgi:Holliday junction resolvase RusA-like endonuclease